MKLQLHLKIKTYLRNHFIFNRFHFQGASMTFTILQVPQSFSFLMEKRVL